MPFRLYCEHVHDIPAPTRGYFVSSVSTSTTSAVSGVGSGGAHQHTSFILSGTWDGDWVTPPYRREIYHGTGASLPGRPVVGADEAIVNVQVMSSVAGSHSHPLSYTTAVSGVSVSTSPAVVGIPDKTGKVIPL